MSEHTPTPWDYVPSTEHHGPYITSDHGGTIADLYLMSEPGAWSTASGGTSKPISFFHEMADPNAALIVRAVNNHDALVKALTELRNEVRGWLDAYNPYFLAVMGNTNVTVMKDRVTNAEIALAKVKP